VHVFIPYSFEHRRQTTSSPDDKDSERAKHLTPTQQPMKRSSARAREKPLRILPDFRNEIKRQTVIEFARTEEAIWVYLKPCNNSRHMLFQVTSD
jgi:hypothetical protein